MSKPIADRRFFRVARRTASLLLLLFLTGGCAVEFGSGPLRELVNSIQKTRSEDQTKKAVVPRAYLQGLKNIPIKYINSRTLSIPFRLKEPDQVRAVELWTTSDDGQHWIKVDRKTLLEEKNFTRTKIYAKRDVESFIFLAPADGLYGFQLASVMLDGTYDLVPRPGVYPQQLVQVDTKPPVISLLSPSRLRTVTARDNPIVISWKADDEHLRTDGVKVDTSLDGGRTWKTLGENQSAEGSLSWSVPSISNAQGLVRVIAQDKAGNLTLSGSEQAFAVETLPPEIRPTGPTTCTEPEVKLQYQVSFSGPAGIRDFLLWYRRVETTEWHKLRYRRRVGQEIKFRLPDGRYEFFFTARDKLGNTSTPPAPETAGTLRLVLDRTPPLISLQSLNGGEVLYAGQGFPVRFTVKEENLVETSVSLFHSADDGMKWDLVAAGIPVGTPYYWKVPATPGVRHRLRLTVLDRLGHRAEDHSFKPFAIFSERPAIVIKDLAANRNEIDIAYDILHVPGNEIRSVKIWVTTNGGETWAQYGADPDHVSPAVFSGPRGDYGFALTLEAQHYQTPPPVQGTAPEAKIALSGVPINLRWEKPTLGIDRRYVGGEQEEIRWSLDRYPYRTENLQSEFSLSLDEGKTWTPLNQGVFPSFSSRLIVPARETAGAMLGLQVKDSYGNEGRIVGRPFVIDRTPPLVTFKDYVERSREHEIPITYQALDRGPAGLDRVELWEVAWSAGGLPSRVRKIDEFYDTSSTLTLSIPNGRHHLFFRALDKAGNENLLTPPPNPAIYSILIDSVPPQIRFVDAVWEQTDFVIMENNCIPISWTVLDESPRPNSVTLSYSVDQGRSWKIIQENLPLRKKEFKWVPPFDKTTQKAITLRLQATDELDNTGTKESGLVFRSNLKSFALAMSPLVSPSKKFDITGRWVNSDSLELPEKFILWYRTRGSLRWQKYSELQPYLGANRSLLVSFEAKDNGLYEFYLSGFSSSSPQLPVDGLTQPQLTTEVLDQAPQIRLRSPRENIKVLPREPLELSWSAWKGAGDLKSITLLTSEDQKIWKPVHETTEPSGSLSWTIPLTASGVIYLKGQCLDQFDRTGESEVRCLTLDTVPPQVIRIAPPFAAPGRFPLRLVTDKTFEEAVLYVTRDNGANWSCLARTTGTLLPLDLEEGNYGFSFALKGKSGTSPVPAPGTRPQFRFTSSSRPADALRFLTFTEGGVHRANVNELVRWETDLPELHDRPARLEFSADGGQVWQPLTRDGEFRNQGEFSWLLPARDISAGVLRLTVWPLAGLPLVIETPRTFGIDLSLPSLRVNAQEPARPAAGPTTTIPAGLSGSEASPAPAFPGTLPPLQLQAPDTDSSAAVASLPPGAVASLPPKTIPGKSSLSLAETAASLGQNPDDLFCEAESHFLAEDYEQARVRYLKLLEGGEKQVIPCYRLGLIYERFQPNPTLARKYLEQAVEIDPGYAPAHNELGRSLYGEKKFPEALEAFARATQADGGVAVFQLNEGIASYRTNDPQRAVKALSKALSLDPTLKEASWYLAKCFNVLGDTASEQIHLSRVVDAYGTDSPMGRLAGARLQQINQPVPPKKADHPLPGEMPPETAAETKEPPSPGGTK